MKILITGGHLSPALAVIDEIGKKADIIFVGRKYSTDNEKNYSLEYQEILKRHILFYYLPTGRLTRLINFKLILNLLKIPYGFYQALIILIQVKPTIILSFGGYIGAPICIAGFILRIPIFIHEQTINPGLSNRLIGILAKKIFVAFPQSIKAFPQAKVTVSGNPVRKSVLTIHTKPYQVKKKPVIYITGGSLGSHSINRLIESLLPNLLVKYTVIHQTGNVSEYQDFQRFSGIRKNLTPNLKQNYFIQSHFFTDELGVILAKSDLVICRSGANTFFEIIALRKPSILIPLPWSAGGEQQEQAKLLKNAGVAEIFNQSQDPSILLSLIEKVITKIQVYKNNFKKVELLYKQDAVKIIAQTILSKKSS